MLSMLYEAAVYFGPILFLVLLVDLFILSIVYGKLAIRAARIERKINEVINILTGKENRR